MCFHDLRHSSAIRRVTNGVPVNVVHTLARHELTTGTLDMYTDAPDEYEWHAIATFARPADPEANGAEEKREGDVRHTF